MNKKLSNIVLNIETDTGISKNIYRSSNLLK
jgi:hypothetical protein